MDGYDSGDVVLVMITETDTQIRQETLDKDISRDGSIYGMKIKTEASERVKRGGKWGQQKRQRDNGEIGGQKCQKIWDTMSMVSVDTREDECGSIGQ